MTWKALAEDLRARLRSRRAIVHDAASALAILAAEGVRLDFAPIDLAELAQILVPGLAATDLDAIAEAFEMPQQAFEPGFTSAERLLDIFASLRRRIAEYDDLTLERLELHATEAGFSFAELFRQDVAALTRATCHVDRLLPPELSFLQDRARPEELEPTGSIEPIDEDDVQAILGPAGSLANVISGFERRPQQEQMASAVARTINASGQILVEAGTGTGKSLAYLVPAALSASERGLPVMLSTNTLALQDQLLRKDVPDLVTAVQRATDNGAIDVVAVKGRANYLCLRKWFPWERQASQDPDEARLKTKVLAWLPRTETGDRAELRLTGAEEAHWRSICEEDGACDPGTCVFHQRGQCFVFRARREAESAHLVVVNHALLLTDASSSNRILPDYDTLIVDEAHHLEDQATTQFTVSLYERDVTEYADAIVAGDETGMTGIVAGAVAFLLGAIDSPKAQERARIARAKLEDAVRITNQLRAAGRDLFAALELVHLDSAEFSNPAERTRRVTPATRSSNAWEGVDAAWDRLLTALREAETVLRWFASAVDDVDDVTVTDMAEAGERQELLLNDLSNVLRVGSELASKFASSLDAPETSRVYWLERMGISERVVFRSAPLDVSELLRDRLFKKPRATILTSATLAVDGSCDYVATRLGVPDASSLIVPSPFDYRASVLLYLADDMPDPTHPHYREALERTLIDVLAASRGRALVLFTSHAMLSDVASMITAPLQDAGIEVLAQRRDGSPQQLVERLRRQQQVAVLGTASFWEGVDVAGEALSLLIITRLPFSVPTDPIFAARSESFDDAFNGYAVPQAVLRFKQGFGRLIRSSRDRGVCAVLDRRILTKRYGTTFLQSLPECSVEVGGSLDLPRAAQRWLEPAGSTAIASELANFG